MIDLKDIDKVLDRIARTPDGEALYRFLQKEAQSLPADGSVGALRSHDGRRSFALDLMGHMAKGIDARAGSAAHSASDGKLTERAVVFERPGPVAVGRRESAREWIARTDPELDAARSSDKPTADY